MYKLLNRYFNLYYLVSLGFKLDNYVSKGRVLPFGVWGIVLFLNNPLKYQKSRWIISTYNSYEWINNHAGFFLWPWLIDYKRKGFSRKKDNITVDPFHPDAISYHTPWHNI